jgi:hypothetical protein
MNSFTEAIEKVPQIDEWLQAGEYGDPNGAKCYQARKLFGDMTAALERAKRDVDRLVELVEAMRDYCPDISDTIRDVLGPFQPAAPER